MNKKVELLAPAGSLEKLKIAYLYGADACYIGGKKFSLRARASNFTLDDIKEASLFASSLSKKLYVTMNIVPHENDFEGLEEYLKYLESVKVTGIIVSSMSIAKKSIEVSPKLEVHLSTQCSCTNSEAVKFYQKMGFKRVVLAREVSLEKIKEINEKIEIETEVFIHGGMCVSYSGRCMLSNHLTNRDANRGGCAHSCRWNYDLYCGKSSLESKCVNHDLNCYMNMGSKDLMSVDQIYDLIKCGVSSLKIEGRMKSLYYIATVVKCYRDIIDCYYNNIEFTKNLSDYYQLEISKAENRLASTGFLKGMVTLNEQLYNVRSEMPTKDFLGIVLDYDTEKQIVTLEQRNYFQKGDMVEFFGPGINTFSMTIGTIYDENENELDVARHPLQIIKFFVPNIVQKNVMMRKK